jgi:hypothetical protein
MFGGISHKIASRKTSSYTGGGTVQKLKFVALAHANSPFITVYEWTGSGFGAKVSNPATLPPAQCNDVKFTSNGDAIIIAHNNSPYISAYGWSNGGFGTKFNDPATLPAGNAKTVKVRSGNNAIILAHTTSPWISGYPWSSSSGFGTKYTDPAVVPSLSTVGDVDFDADGDRVVYTRSQAAAAYFVSFNVSTGFGSGTFVSITGGWTLKFSPNNTAIAITNNYAISMSAFVYTPSTNSIGSTRYDPAVRPGFYPVTFAWSSNSNSVVACGPSSELGAWPWNSPGFGTKFSAPSPAPGGTVVGAAFTSDDSHVAIAHGNSPYLSVYQWSNSTGFGTKVSDPSSLPAGAGQRVAFIDMP